MMMRKLIPFVFLTSFFCLQLTAQDWVRQHPFPVLNQLTAITFDEQGIGWAVGVNSSILYTENWGGSWQEQEPPQYGVALLSVEIVPGSNAQKAFIGGNTLLKTVDGGQNWEQILGFFNPIYQIQALDDQNIFAFGTNSTNQKSSDGGETWSDFPAPAEGSMRGYFIDPLVGWGTAGLFQNVQLFKTLDGGESWALLDTTRYTGIFDIHMMDAQMGFMASRQDVLKTLDGGNSWTIISDEQISSITDFHIVNEQEIWASNNNGSIYFTLDGGNSWTLSFPDVFASNSTRGIYATTGGQSWACGKYSSVLHTSNSGQTWQDQTPGNKNALLDIEFFDDNNGFAAGRKGVVLKTTDGGAIWEEMTINPEQSINSLAMTSPSTVFLLFDNGELTKSTDGGQNWITIADQLEVNYRIEAISEQQIYIYSSFGHIIATTDGGDTWTQLLNNFDYTSTMHFSSSSTGWIASNGGNILKTTDAGQTWNTTNVADMGGFEAIYFVDDMEGWVIGSFIDSLFHTTDGGVSWETQYLGQSTFWQDISFMDRDTGWIVGGSSGQSKIMKTTDGGENWEQVYTDQAQLISLSSLSSNKVWAAGIGGNIVHFSSCNAIPQLNNLTGRQQLCEGDTVQYQVNSSNVTIFNWQLPDDWVFLSNSNSALVEVLVGAEAGLVQLIGENSCDLSTNPISLAVTVNTAAEVNLTVDDDNILEVLPEGLNYTWYLNGMIIDQSTNNTWAVQESGLYHVVVTFAAGCNASSDIVNIMITGSEELDIQNAIQVFPNPSSGIFQLRLADELSNAQITVMDNTAKLVYRHRSQAQTSLDLSFLESGVYYIAIKTDQGVFYKKILLL